MPYADLLHLAALAMAGSCPKTVLEKSFTKFSDWENLFYASWYEGLLPYIYHSILKKKINIPDHLADFSNTVYRKHIIQHKILSAEIIRISMIFRAAEIKYAWIKGPVLASLFYSSPELRPSNDIDLLIKEIDLKNALKVLGKAGYLPFYTLTDSQQKIFNKYNKHTFLMQQKNKAVLELHTAVAAWEYFFRYPAQNIVDSSITVSFYNEKVSAPRAEDSLLISAIHGAMHAWDKIIWICDSAAIIKKIKNPDWNRIFNSVKNLPETKNALELCLALASGIFRSNLPEQAQKSVAVNSSLKNPVRRITERIARPGRRFNLKNRAKIYTALEPGAPGKILFFLRWMITPCIHDIETVSAGPFFFWIYSIIRIFRLTRLNMGKLLKKN
ncbi:MAG: hypothetical protein A2096_11070 [Spirochaetes bacterium GWF1_41_5]|nr:MAG: hypothetical protein A2096_11070 [Spirochaetes bacterium GWF1_41_5]HBE03335.1 hypothetical protein [Spirochaetia bacterium]